MAQIQNVDIETQLAYIAGAKRVRRELFGGKDSAVVTISHHGLSFNTACVSLMEGVASVEILIHPVERLLAVRKRSKKCKNVVPWGMKVISAKELSAVIYDLMGWRKSWKYRSLANCFTKGGDQVLLFDLNSCEFRLPRVERGEGPARAVPSSWLSDFGESPPEQLMLCRRALASTLGQWQVGASASAVDGFGNDIKTLSREEAEKRIADMRSGGEING